MRKATTDGALRTIKQIKCMLEFREKGYVAGINPKTGLVFVEREGGLLLAYRSTCRDIIEICSKALKSTR